MVGNVVYYQVDMNYYVTYSDKNYLCYAERVFKRLKEVSNYKILYFTLDFHYESEFDNVIPIPYEVKVFNPDNKRADFIFSKIDILNFILKLFPDDNFCAVDADIIPFKNIDSIFDRFNELENYPLMNRSCWDYISYDESINSNYMEDLFKLLGSDISMRDNVYTQATLYLFNRSCQDFITEWLFHGYNKEMRSNINKYVPAYEETLFNVVRWKNKMYNSLGQVSIDCPDFKSSNLSHFLNALSNPPEQEYVYTGFTRIPSKNEFSKIKALHGRMGESDCDFILQFLKQNNL